MNISKKNIISLLALSLFSLASIGLAQSLAIEFEASPLFSETNFLPGDSVERFIKITNNGDREKPVIVSAVNVNDPDGFSQTFSIEIREGVTLLYSETLSNFFNEDEVSLSNLGSGAQAQYDFKIALKAGMGDTYQEKQLGFDIVIGFEGETAIGGEAVTSSTRGGGSGGISRSQGLQIFSETALPVAIDQSMISWQTNYIATSRVIYGTVSGLFDSNNPPNYGYPFSTPEINTPASVNGSVNHLVILSELTPRVTYYYRVVSTASPATISFERSFRIDPEAVEELGGAEYLENLNSGGGFAPPKGLVLGDYQEEVKGYIENAGEEIAKTEAEDENELLTAQESAGLSFSWPWWILLLVLIIIAYFIFKRKREG